MSQLNEMHAAYTSISPYAGFYLGEQCNPSWHLAVNQLDASPKIKSLWLVSHPPVINFFRPPLITGQYGSQFWRTMMSPECLVHASGRKFCKPARIHPRYSRPVYHFTFEKSGIWKLRCSNTNVRFTKSRGIPIFYLIRVNFNPVSSPDCYCLNLHTSNTDCAPGIMQSIQATGKCQVHCLLDLGPIKGLSTK